MANGKIPNINNKFFGEKLVEVTFPDSTSSLGFNEFDATLNTVNTSVSSSIIMDADYALNARIPTNNDRLLSGTAQRMEIQDSNYSSVAWTSPRYVGSKTISATYNDYQASGSSVTFDDGTTGTWKGDQVFNEYPGDSTFSRGNPLGKVPAIDLYTTHFALFDRIEIDNAFADRDIFHCLYLIDDQGNKVPLSYKNKNIIDMQRVFVPGTNAEVIFLGQNNQEVLDEYPIIRVGVLTSNRANFTNNLYINDSIDNQYKIFFDTDDTVASNAYVRHTFINQSQTDYTLRFIPSALNFEDLGSNEYKITYANPSVRDSLLTGSSTPNIDITVRNFYIRRTTLTTPPISFFLDNTSSVGPNIKEDDIRYNPFYYLTYNPQTQKIFEGTDLEQQVEWDFLFLPPPVNTTQVFRFEHPPGYPNLPTSDNFSISPSQYADTWSPLSVGDLLTFGKFPVTTSIDNNLIGTYPNVSENELVENLRDYFSPSSGFLQLEVTDINVAPVSMSYYVNHIQGILAGNIEYYDQEGNSTSQTLGSLLQYIQSHYRDITGAEDYVPVRNDIQPNFTSLATDSFIANPSSVPGNKGQFQLYVDDFAVGIQSGNPGFQLQSVDPSNVMGMLVYRGYKGGSTLPENIFDDLCHGDIIEFRGLNVAGTEFTGPIFKYKILTHAFNPTNTDPDYHKAFRLQYISTNDLIQGYNMIVPFPGNVANLSGRLLIHRVIKFYAPFIKAKPIDSSVLVSDATSSINSAGTVLNITQNNDHEQYIESQFLTGSGVGVIIPDQYDPKLREQLPDIINKTGIDVNSLTQGSN